MHRPYNAITPTPAAWAQGENRITMSLVDILHWRAARSADAGAFDFLEGDSLAEALTYQELDRSARAIAAGLSERFEPRSRVALVFPPGLDFIKSFFGCVYADMIPIPATYPKPRRPSARLSAIVNDSDPAAILAPSRVIETVAESSTRGDINPGLWLDFGILESADADGWEQPDIDPDSIAFLQYTSGSTSDPRGVMVTHRNIATNLEMIRQGFGLSYEEENIGVSWLPAYHDMGLIGGILESIYVGGTTVLMSPLGFLQKPMRWLKMISRYGAMISGGPNFAYELCVRRFSPDDLQGLDLSSWRVAFSGAEPIRAGTMRRFAETFAPYGFSQEAFYPCYGLAEATLLATGGRGPSAINTCWVSAKELRESGRACVVEPESPTQSSSVELVSCGGKVLDEEIRIVDPESRQTCADGQVGEIWIRGRNVAAGYWNRPTEDAKTFRCEPVDAPGIEFLRTGDLGFLLDDQLYVTGRQKQLLIIRGKNHYPHDIEATAQLSNSRLIPGGGAAILVERVDDERLVIIQEIERTTAESEYDPIIQEIRKRISEEHDLFVHEVVLIRTNSLPRTTSGKVRYSEAEAQFRNDDLSVLAHWSFADNHDASPAGDSVESQNDYQTSILSSLTDLSNISDPVRLAEEIEHRLMLWLSQMASTPVEDLSAGRPLSEYGLDSITAMEMIDQLESGTGLKLDPSIAWTYPTPALLSGHLAHLMTGSNDTTLLEDGDDSELNEFADLLSQIEQMPEDELSRLLSSEDHAEKTE